MTAFGKACEKLGVSIIKAYSPEAKGRVERFNGIYQDRLIKDMAFHGITDKESGNKWLRERFLTEMNERFSHPPLSPENFHQEVPAGVKLNDVLYWRIIERYMETFWFDGIIAGFNLKEGVGRKPRRMFQYRSDWMEAYALSIEAWSKNTKK